MQLLLLILAIIPVIVILTYIYKKDSHKEPSGLLVTLFIMGILSCFMVLAVTRVVHFILPFLGKGTDYMSFFEIMAYAFIGVALVEEFCKFFMTYLVAYKNKAYDEVYDGIVYAVFVSIGFAFFENLLYVFGNQSITVGIVRGISAVPGHACDAVFMGYYLSIAKVYSKQGNKQLERKNLILSVLAPTILHGIYDFCLFTKNIVFLILFIIFVVFLYIGSFKKIKQLSKNSKQNQQPQQNKARGFEPQVVPNMNISNQTSTPNNNFNSQPVQNNGFNQPVQNSGYVNQNNSYNQPSQNNGYVNQNNGYVNQNNGYVNQNSNFNNPTNQNNGYINQNQNNFCRTCGAQINGEFCQNCGTKQN